MQAHSSNIIISTRSLNDIDSMDWHRIMRLRSNIFVSEQNCVYTDPDSLDLNAVHIYMQIKDHIIGYARIVHHTNWHIGRVLIDQEHRGLGFSNQLINKALHYISEKCQVNDSIELSAQLYLVDFYTRHHFFPVKRFYLEDGIPHIKMVYQRNT